MKRPKLPRLNRRRKRTLVDVWRGDLDRRDDNPAPPVDLRRRLYPIRHSSSN